jgi:hypothetical protein
MLLLHKVNGKKQITIWINDRRGSRQRRVDHPEHSRVEMDQLGTTMRRKM